MPEHPAVASITTASKRMTSRFNSFFSLHGVSHRRLGHCRARLNPDRQTRARSAQNRPYWGYTPLAPAGKRVDQQITTGYCQNDVLPSHHLLKGICTEITTGGRRPFPRGGIA